MGFSKERTRIVKNNPLRFDIFPFRISTSAVNMPASEYAGKVVETMNSAGYTYICLEKDGKKRWAAIPATEVKDGDEIAIDIPARKIELKVTKAELAKRKKAWKKPEPKIKTGWLARYSRNVTSANTGAVMK